MTSPTIARHAARPRRDHLAGRRGTPMPAGISERGRCVPCSVTAGAAPAWSTTVARPNGYCHATVGGLPVLLTRTAEGDRARVPQHMWPPWRPAGRGLWGGPSPRCPYHGWVYRLDGGLSAPAVGLEGTDGVDSSTALYPVQVATWARFVFVNPDVGAAPFELGPLAASLNHPAVATAQLAVRESTSVSSTGRCSSRTTARTSTRRSSIPISSSTAGTIPSSRPANSPWRGTGRSTRATGPRRPPRPGRGRRVGRGGGGQIDDVFIAGVYVTVFPNLLVSAFPRYLSALLVTALGPTDPGAGVPVLDTRRPAERRDADLAASRVVGRPRTSTSASGCSGATRPGSTPTAVSPHLESGVRHVHELVWRGD